jgi:hypothetical protein
MHGPGNIKNNIKLIYLTVIHITYKIEKHKQPFLSENYEPAFPNKKHKQSNAHEKHKQSFPSENYNRTLGIIGKLSGCISVLLIKCRLFGCA